MISDYRLNAARIGNAIEARCPALWRCMPAGCDFRPGGGGERICFRTNSSFIFPLEDVPRVDESGPIEFQVVYGGWEKCLEGIGALMGLGIDFECKSKRSEGILWKLSFVLPQDWKLP